MAKLVFKIVIALGWLLLCCFETLSLDLDCTSKSLTYDKTYEIPGHGYYMQMAGSCRMTYTGSGGIGTKMYNYCSKRSERITGDMDSVAVPGKDFELYTHPGEGIEFLDAERLLTSQDSSNLRTSDVLAYNDPEMRGVYQSIGVLSSGANTKRLRVSIGWRAGRFRDYEVKKNGQNFRFTPISSPTDVCQNLPSSGLDTELPIISKDGQFIAGREYDGRTTKVFKISTPSGNCTEVAEIGNLSSKVNFGYNNEVYYITQDPNTGKGRLMRLDLNTGETVTLSGPTEDVQFSATRYDGKLFYTRSIGSSSSSELVEVNQDKLNFGNNQAALGIMWANSCGYEVDLDQAKLIGARLNNRDCQKIVYDDATIVALEGGGLSRSQMQSLCPRDGAVSNGAGRANSVE